MPVINSYTEQFAPQGGLNVQADPNDFGANVGAALHNFGEALYKNEQENDVTNVHVEMAKTRAVWQQKLTDMANQTKPGDDTFVPRVMGAMQQDFDALSQNVKTRQGQLLFSRMQADMTSMFGQEAVGIQSRLNGEFAKNQFTEMSTSLGTVAAQDHTQLQSLLTQAKATIDDPNGKFARVPEATREAFRQSIKEQLEFDAARGFARKYPNAVLGSVPTELRDTVRNLIANPPTPGLPPDLKAPLVKPFTQQDVGSRAKAVLAASPYDAAFQAAAQKYNLDWRELKMRAVVESSLNPNADNGQAQGIMQMTPDTAKYLGVNPMDPTSAIMGAAKLIAEYRTKAGGDMAKVDQMYYGGASGTAWGPNTQQYAANMAALRQTVGLGTAVPPEAFAPVAQAEAGQAQNERKARTGIDFIDRLPADKFFSILTDAEHYQRAYDTESERARIERDRLERKAQEAQMNGFLQRIITPNTDNGGPLSEQEIMGNQTLTWEQKQHLVDYNMRRTRELAANAEPKTNPAEVRRLMLQIHAADDDPTKTYNMDPIMESYKAGTISTSEMSFLRKEVEQLRDGNTSGFQKDVQNARNVVFTSLSRSILGQAQPEVAADAAYRFSRDMEQQIEAYRKQNKDPRVLLDPMSREYLLKPERIQSFMQGSGQALGQGAAQVAKQQAGSLPTYKEFDSLPVGASFTDPQGNVRVKR